eukprot:6583652-Pyramimonas_sp.AAC.1
MVNPACRANADDGSSRCRMVGRPLVCNATCVTEKAIERRRVRNQLRQEPVLNYSSEAECLSRTLYHAHVSSQLQRKEKPPRVLGVAHRSHPAQTILQI